MHIQKKRIKNLANHLTNVPPLGTFKVIHTLGDDYTRTLERLGFDTNVNSGEIIVPTIRGPISRYNADGKWFTNKDLPKEERYIRTVMWRWTEHHGDTTVEREEERDIYRLCYPRTLLSPPSIDLQYVEVDNERLIVSPEMSNSQGMEDINKHVINLMLELLGSVEIVSSSFQRISPPVSRNANWKFLPSGSHPWETLETAIISRTRSMSEDNVSIILDRQHNIINHSPSEIWTGQGGFNDYVAYVFPEKGKVVMESIQRGNAIYIFSTDWQTVSRLTKAEIINNNMHLARIVHSKGWQGRLRMQLEDINRNASNQ